jgi:NAD(P)-dependent dehydrogenase (short-subunit alcohol dehydrogenase family)
VPLNQKHALVTGASRGIGRGIALKLAEDGASVAVHYYRNESAANETLSGIRSRGVDGFRVQADVCCRRDPTHVPGRQSTIR